jgi:hypothetical protein
MHKNMTLHEKSSRTISTDCWYPYVLSDGSGLLVMGLRCKTGGMTLLSRDAGVTWQKNTTNVMDFIPAVMPDRSVLGFGMLNAIQTHVRQDQVYKPFIAMIRRASDLEALLAGDTVDDFVKVDIPGLAGNVGDADDYALGTIDHGIVSLPDGRLLMTMYGRFQSDCVPVPYYGDGAYQFRSWVCQSTDGGATWRFLQTLAANERAQLPTVSEGYCEPDLILLQDGSLLSVMRTGGCSYKGSPERYTSLYSTRSTDSGRTWSTPVPICPFGVWPRLLQLSDGTVVCASGRPGVFLILSQDGGQTWSEPEFLTRFDDDWGRCASGYNSICELKPGELTIFYDDVNPDDPDRTHITRMATFAVEVST